MLTRENGVWGPVVIDFCRLTPRAIVSADFARLEAGIVVKCLRAFLDTAGQDPQRHEEFMMFENLLNGAMPIPAAVDNISVNLRKIVTVVGAIRRTFLRIAGLPPQDDSRFYFATLMLSYLGYLRPHQIARFSAAQRNAALYLSANIWRKHLK